MLVFMVIQLLPLFAAGVHSLPIPIGVPHGFELVSHGHGTAPSQLGFYSPRIPHHVHSITAITQTSLVTVTAAYVSPTSYAHHVTLSFSPTSSSSPSLSSIPSSSSSIHPPVITSSYSHDGLSASGRYRGSYKVAYANIHPRDTNASHPSYVSIVDMTESTATSTALKSRYLDITEAPEVFASSTPTPTSTSTSTSTSTTSSALVIITAPPEIPLDYKTITITQCQHATASVISLVDNSCSTLYGIVPQDFEMPTTAAATAITTTVIGVGEGNPIITIVIPVSAPKPTDTTTMTLTSTMTPTETETTTATTTTTETSTAVTTSTMTATATDIATMTTTETSTATTLSTVVISSTITSTATATPDATTTTMDSTTATPTSALETVPPTAESISGNDTRGDKVSTSDTGSSNDGDSFDQGYNRTSGAAAVVVNAIVWPVIGAVVLAITGLMIAALI